MTKKSSLGIYLVVFLVILRESNCQKNKLNTRCRARGTRGTCLLQTNCPGVLEDAEKGIRPQLCGQYSPNLSIVCCPGALPIFNTPPPPNEISLLEVPDGVVFPETGEGSSGSGLQAGQVGYVASQKCTEYLPVQQLSFTGLSLDNEPTVINITKCTKNGVPLIVGGADVDPGEFPFMVAIGWADGDEIDYLCGGTLISDQFVLTAAHCTFKRESGSPTVVRIGSINIKDTENDRTSQNYRISEIKTHEDYTGITHYNDIALLKLHRKIGKFTDFIRPACLWTRNSFDATNAIVTGWGHIEEAGIRSEILQKVTLKLYAKEVCQARYRNMKKLPQGIPDSMICSGYLPGGRDTCQGDSGGPLLTKKIDESCEYYLIGITSFGIGCAKKNTPGLYTRVSSYLSWIEKNVWN